MKIFLHQPPNHKNVSHQMKSTKCPAKEKENEARNEEKREEERKKKVKVKTAVSLVNPKTMS